MPIRAVTFDLWLTLIWDSKELEEYRKLRRLMNFSRFTSKIANNGGSPRKLGLGDIRLAMEEMSLEVKKLYEQGYDASPEERGRLLFKILKIKVQKETANQVYEQAGKILSNAGYFSKFPKLNPEAKPTFKLLKENLPDLKIALISNAARSTATYRRMLSSFGIEKYFDEFVISCEVGYLKPRREIFQRALSLLKVEPKETLHVGDLFRADILGAAAAGMNACLYTGLWHKYAQYMNPGEHVPGDFRATTVVKEIGRLQEAASVAKKIL
ncbi:MAG: HAD family hydrolase [Nitrososphaerales archaeon]